jgi:hypothetical protein
MSPDFLLSLRELCSAAQLDGMCGSRFAAEARFRKVPNSQCSIRRAFALCNPAQLFMDPGTVQSDTAASTSRGKQSGLAVPENARMPMAICREK